jgi:hypothetical protein
MKDPTRIPRVLDELRDTWEGQPDLTLATLFGILDTNGIGWGSTDDELIDALRALRRAHPSALGSHVHGRYVVDTESPRNRITIDPFRVCVRRIVSVGERRPQPGIWEYSSIPRCRTGEILVIRDHSGIDHRCGVVSAITLVNEKPEPGVPTLDGAVRRELENVYWVELAGGNGALIDHGIDVYMVSRREVAHRRLAWEKLEVARPGSTLRVRSSGGTVEDLGEVERIILLEG